MHPDDVVSAQHYDGLCRGLRQRGWLVEAHPCNRGCFDDSQVHPRDEWCEGVHYRRVWRPAFRQSTTVGRLLNAMWMVGAWSRIAARPPTAMPDVILVGTDPLFAALAAIPLRVRHPSLRVAHWCFDLHPECAIGEGQVRADSAAVRAIRALLRRAYRRCDLMVDLGPCMRERLRAYGHGRREATIVPWALCEPARPEPPVPEVRRALFGDARLALLYSGNFGLAHSADAFLTLARAMEGDDVQFCFAVRGNRADDLAAAASGRRNVSLVGFASLEDLPARLASADIHLASLKPEWSGAVVPSKFFGSLAAGRPVLFSGSRDSAIAQWIEQHDVGWVLDGKNVAQVAGQLRRIVSRPDILAEMRERCFNLYHKRFSQARGIDAWDRELRAILPVARIKSPRV